MLVTITEGNGNLWDPGRANVSKVTGRLDNVYQVESIQSYTNPAADIVRCDASIKNFDENGHPFTGLVPAAAKHLEYVAKQI